MSTALLATVGVMSLGAIKQELQRRGVMLHGLIERQDLIQALASAMYYDDPDGYAVCAVCASGDDEEGNDLLLCDGAHCTVAYHLQCLPVPLASVPPGAWMCPACSSLPALTTMRMGALRAELQSRGVSTNGLLERADFEQALAAARERALTPTAGSAKEATSGAARGREEATAPAAEQVVRTDANVRDGGSGAKRKRERGASAVGNAAGGGGSGSCGAGRSGVASGGARAQAPRRRRAAATSPQQTANDTDAGEGGGRPATQQGLRPEAERDGRLDVIHSILAGGYDSGITPRQVRHELEVRLGMARDALRAEKEEVNALINEAIAARLRHPNA